MRYKPLQLWLLIAASLLPLASRPALAWGPEAHRAIALIADRVLQQTDPAAHAKLVALLNSDKDNKLTKHDIGSEATWADVLRDKSEEARAATAEWHYARLKFDSPDLTRDCFGHPALPVGYPASHGPRENCVVDKIDQFAKELQNADTPPGERLTALQFLLNLVGDVNDPLQAIDRGDHQGQCVAIEVGGGKPVRLSSYWDVTLVSEVLGKDAASGATSLSAALTPAAVQKWSAGSPGDWAQEAYQVAKNVTYSILKAGPAGKYSFPQAKGAADPCGGGPVVYKPGPEYETAALAAVKEQLLKAGVRLAVILRENLK